MRAGEYDVAGTIVGVVERDRILDGSRIAAGRRGVGLPSVGLQTNGYTLARKVFFEQMGKRPHGPPARARRAPSATRCSIRTSPTCEPLEPLLAEDLVHGMAHLTGGGFYDNIPRVLPDGPRRRRQVRRLAGACRSSR